MKIGDNKIGEGNPCYVIAEMSANHNGDFQAAERLVYAAHEAGANAIKLQTYTADTITLASDKEWFQIGGGTLWDGKTLHELYAEAYTPWEWQPKLKELAGTLGMDCFSSPFDFSAVEFLEQMDVPAYKIASFELVDIPLIKRCAQTGKPLIMSTGMASLGEIEEAVRAATSAGAKDLALLVCSSAYPSPPEAIRLDRIPFLKSAFSVETGLSDHTQGVAIPVASIAKGASIIEKHLCLDRADGGPDAAFSLEPAEFKDMVDAVRFAERACGRIGFGGHQAEKSSKTFRRSLFVAEDIKKGEVFSERNLRSVRPAHGLHTRHYDEVIGQRADKDVSFGTPLDWSMVKRDEKPNEADR